MFSGYQQIRNVFANLLFPSSYLSDAFRNDVNQFLRSPERPAYLRFSHRNDAELKHRPSERFYEIITVANNPKRSASLIGEDSQYYTPAPPKKLKLGDHQAQYLHHCILCLPKVQGHKRGALDEPHENEPPSKRFRLLDHQRKDIASNVTGHVHEPKPTDSIDSSDNEINVVVEEPVILDTEESPANNTLNLSVPTIAKPEVVISSTTSPSLPAFSLDIEKAKTATFPPSSSPVLPPEPENVQNVSTPTTPALCATSNTPVAVLTKTQPLYLPSEPPIIFVQPLVESEHVVADEEAASRVTVPMDGEYTSSVSVENTIYQTSSPALATAMEEIEVDLLDAYTAPLGSSDIVIPDYLLDRWERQDEPMDAQLTYEATDGGDAMVIEDSDEEMGESEAGDDVSMDEAPAVTTSYEVEMTDNTLPSLVVSDSSSPIGWSPSQQPQMEIFFHEEPWLRNPDPMVSEHMVVDEDGQAFGVAQGRYSSAVAEEMDQDRDGGDENDQRGQQPPVSRPALGEYMRSLLKLGTVSKKPHGLNKAISKLAPLGARPSWSSRSSANVVFSLHKPKDPISMKRPQDKKRSAEAVAKQKSIQNALRGRDISEMFASSSVEQPTKQEAEGRREKELEAREEAQQNAAEDDIAEGIEMWREPMKIYRGLDGRTYYLSDDSIDAALDHIRSAVPGSKKAFNMVRRHNGYDLSQSDVYTADITSPYYQQPFEIVAGIVSEIAMRVQNMEEYCFDEEMETWRSFADMRAEAKAKSLKQNAEKLQSGLAELALNTTSSPILDRWSSHNVSKGKAGQLHPSGFRESREVELDDSEEEL